MSNGFKDAMSWLCLDRDAIDGLDEWDFDEITQKIELDGLWDDFRKDYERPKCECGAEKANTTHARYCPKYKEHK